MNSGNPEELVSQKIHDMEANTEGALSSLSPGAKQQMLRIEEDLQDKSSWSSFSSDVTLAFKKIASLGDRIALQRSVRRIQKGASGKQKTEGESES
jgi:hypothetical protein